MGVEPTQDESIAPQTVLKFGHRSRRLPHPSASAYKYPCKQGVLTSQNLGAPHAPAGG
jgi:hypothetical protein